MRLFIAIGLTDEMKDSIEAVQDKLRAQRIRGNYTVRENMHLTLAFIGEFNDPDRVLEVMENVRFKPFTLKMNHIGTFPDVWWAGLEDSEELTALVKSLRHELAEAGIPFDKKKFTPHITMLRKRVDPDRNEAGLNIDPTQMTVDHFSLMLSTRGKNGMIYTELGRVES